MSGKFMINMCVSSVSENERNLLPNKIENGEFTNNL